MKYDVTIGIPIYNVEKYIRLAMDSALTQTFKNIEFLVLDDCGTDSSIDIVREYQQTHPRGKDIRIVRQPHNMGIGQARNRIVQETQGKYLYFMDADDLITPNTIEILYTNACRYNADLVYGSHERIENFEGEKKTFKCQYPQLLFLKDDEFANWVYRQYNGIQAMTWNILIDIDIFRKNSLSYPSANFWEDFSFTMDLPTYVTRVVLLPDITYYYNCRYGSLSNFSKRNSIDKIEIQSILDAMTLVKQNTSRILIKPYFSQRMFKIMLTHFYIVCAILRNAKITNPPFTNREIRDVMTSPLSLVETLHLKKWRLKNLFLFLLGVLPPFISVFIMGKIGKFKGFI